MKYFSLERNKCKSMSVILSSKITFTGDVGAALALGLATTGAFAGFEALPLPVPVFMLEYNILGQCLDVNYLRHDLSPAHE